MDLEPTVGSPQEEPLEEQYLVMAQQARAEQLRFNWETEPFEVFSADEVSRVVELGSDIYHIFDFLGDETETEVMTAEGQSAFMENMEQNPDLQLGAYVARRLANLHRMLQDRVAIQRVLEAGADSVDEAIGRILADNEYEIEMHARIFQTYLRNNA